MNKIKILPDNLANQIAAGEVVERPASVVKELVENSIDAGARRVQVDIELGGRRLMRVVDDGEGMHRDDAILAFERHATSKIKTLDDLGNIRTLGFRGEALASIASVARVELVTKTEDELSATKVLIEGGKLIDVREAARPVGTTISVRDLFYNTPARRKFMRSEATENYHLTSIVTHYALAHPEIAFTLTNNGRESLRLSPAKDLRERAYQIFGAGLLESLLPVRGGRPFVAEISGFVSAPRERRTTRDAQYFFINGRFVKDKVIAGGLLEGYRSVLPHGVYPVAFLFLEIPPEELDVNVHPAKTEVRFRRTEAVKEAIAEAVRDALKTAGIVSAELKISNAGIQENEIVSSETVQDRSTEQNAPPDTGLKSREIVQPRIEFHFETPSGDLKIDEEFPKTELEPQNDFGESRLKDAETVSNEFEIPVSSTDFEQKAESKLNDEFASGDKTEAANYKPASHFEPEARTEIRDQQSGIAMPPVDSAAKIVKKAEVADVSASKIRPIAQLHDSFIIAVDDEGLLLIDQHVAHERILFDKFRKKETERRIESQNLLLPETFDLTPAQAEAFSAVEEDLEALGFGVMRLSGRTVAIKSVPTDLAPSEVRNLFAEILDTVDPEKRGGAKATFRDEIAASLACKAAVKINMKLTPEKMQWLIDRLLTTSSPTTCPHGRPVILRLTMKDIERGFHRT
jgi:DNA mismatch repair protein MutL